jgi:hypothetical protein
MMRNVYSLLLIVFMLTACAPSTPIDAPLPPTDSPDLPVTSPSGNDPTSPQEPAEMPLLPQPGDAKFERGNVFIQESGLLIRESYPPQIALALSGDLPTPCHQLRVVVSEPDAENQIMVDAYTVVDPNMMCIQVLKSFSETIELGTFPAGHYTVWVNGEMIGEFDS